MVNYAGPDKLIGSLCATVGPTLLYWENVKSLDVQRYVNSIVLKVTDETQEYGGFGTQSWKNSTVSIAMFLLEQSPLTLSDEDTLEGYLETIHTNINQYNPKTGSDTIAGNQVVWTKVLSESRAEELRGIILYEIVAEVRVYISP